MRWPSPRLEPQKEPSSCIGFVAVRSEDFRSLGLCASTSGLSEKGKSWSGTLSHELSERGGNVVQLHHSFPDDVMMTS
eukprot:scaffold5849_cov120-Skeletonema_dohrnii-CCMP3373.AAC.5